MLPENSGTVSGSALSTGVAPSQPASARAAPMATSDTRNNLLYSN